MTNHHGRMWRVWRIHASNQSGKDSSSGYSSGKNRCEVNLWGVSMSEVAEILKIIAESRADWAAQKRRIQEQNAKDNLTLVNMKTNI